EALVERKWRVETTSSPDDAVELLASAEKEGRPYDIVLIDRGLTNPKTTNPLLWKGQWGDPKQAGDQVLTYFTMNHPFICPLILTNHEDLRGAQLLTRQGACEYLLKQLTLDQKRVYGSPGEYIHQRCRAALRQQAHRFLRHRLLAMPSLDK